MSPLQSTVLTTTPSINTTNSLPNDTSTSIQSQIHHVVKPQCKKFPDLDIMRVMHKNDAGEILPVPTQKIQSKTINNLDYIGI